MTGRKPLGPALVEHLDGSCSAKERLALILATIAGKLTVVAAAERLGISEAMFYKLRHRVLQLSLADLEPKPLGRPSPLMSAAAQEKAALATRVSELERDLALQSVRLELAQVLPRVVHSDTTLKKRSPPRAPSPSQRQRRARKRK